MAAERGDPHFDEETQAIADCIDNVQDRFCERKINLGVEMAAAVKDLTVQLYEHDPDNFPKVKVDNRFTGEQTDEPLIRLADGKKKTSVAPFGWAPYGIYLTHKGTMEYRLEIGGLVQPDKGNLYPDEDLLELSTAALNALGSIPSVIEAHQ
jgi:hypothetical protein